jgi:hypothetical protein
MENPKSGVQETRGLRTALFCDITQWVVAISYRLFGTTYRSHPQGSRIQNYAKTSVRNYQDSLRNNTKESSYQLLCGGAYSWTIKFSSRVHTFNYMSILSSIYLIVPECSLHFMFWGRSVNTFHISPQTLQILPSDAIACNRFSRMRLKFKQLNTISFFVLAYVLHLFSLK